MKRGQSIKRPSGVRRYLRRTPYQRISQYLATRRLGLCGQEVFLEPRTRLLRHPENIQLGDGIVIKEGACLCPTNMESYVRIGSWTTVGYHSFIFATAGIEIGQHCLVAPFCYLVDANHGIARNELIRTQPMSASPISIGDDVWLCAGVTVLKGVTIGSGAVISAGAVVSEDIPEYCIAAGNPAKVVGERK